MKVGEIEAELVKLALKPGDMLHVKINRHVTWHEMNEIRQEVQHHLPKGMKMLVTTPDTSVTVEGAARDDEDPDWHYYGSTNHPVEPHLRTQCSDEFCGPRATPA